MPSRSAETSAGPHAWVSSSGTDVEPYRRRLDDLGYEPGVAEDHALYAGLLRSTAAKITPGAAAVRRALAGADISTVEAAAHRLKGSAANVGALELADACAELERAARTGHLPVDGSGAGADITRLAEGARRALETLALELDSSPL